MNCPVCKGPMKPLFNGLFCPRDCDRRPRQTSGSLSLQHDGLDYWAVDCDGNRVRITDSGGLWIEIDDDCDGGETD